MILTPCVSFLTIFIRAFIRYTQLYTELWAHVLTLSQNPENVQQATFDSEQSCEQKFFLKPSRFGFMTGVKISITSLPWQPESMIKGRSHYEAV
jgi:hypothetical protein